MGSTPFRATSCLVIAALLLGCGAPRAKRSPYAYEPTAFRAALEERVPGLPESLAAPPHESGPEIIEQAHRFLAGTPRGPERVRALVRFLSHPAPEGLGLAYDWETTAIASKAVELRRGNCVTLAAVLVGLGRGLGWPVYYAEARTRRPETVEFSDVTALSDHMVVLVTPRSYQMVGDFTGQLEDVEDLRIIDDLTAYAHLVNNVTAQRLMQREFEAGDDRWEDAVDGFRMATQIDPELGRGWNNLGIALSRTGRVEEARAVYQRAVELDTAFGSAEHTLPLMETRGFGDAQVVPRQ